MNRIFYFAILFAMFFAPVHIDAKKKKVTPEMKGVATINRSTAEAHVGFLASDALMGRKAGSEYGFIAGEYLISVLKQLGATPLFDDGYAQNFVGFAVRYGGFAVDKEVVKNIKNQPPYRSIKMRNILAKIEGKNPDEIVVVGAHYDHLGFDETMVGDKIFNGADDNASGVQAVLQILRAFLASGEQPEKTVVFALWDGEEYGLCGSTYFVDNFADIDKVKGYMNFDMIGRNCKEGRPQHFNLMYIEQDTIFKQWLKDDIEKYSLALDPDFDPKKELKGGSDQAPFHKRGVKVVWYQTGGHPELHMPSDEPSLFNWDKMVEITKAAYLCLWKMANLDL